MSIRDYAGVPADVLPDRQCPDCDGQIDRNWKCLGCGAQWDELPDEDNGEPSE